MRVRVLVLALLAALAVAAPARAASQTASLVAASHISVAGASVTYHASWSGWQNPTVSFVVESAGRPAVEVPVGENGPASGSQDFQLAPTVNTRVTLKVTEAGTTVYAPWQTWVRPRIATTLHTGSTTIGAYHVMRRGVSPTFRTLTYPKRPGHLCLRHQVQRFSAGAWRAKVTSACIVQDSTGRVTWTWGGKHASGVRFRVRAVFAGDAYNLAGQSTWLYFRFK